MEQGIMKDGVPCLFEMVMDELECSQRSASSLVRDAFGVGEATVSCPRSLITKDMAVATLENLEYYEKIALAFLLYDEVECVLQSLMIAEKTRLSGSLNTADFLSAWVRVQKDGIWENKLLEALCIIQNYQMLQKLGCSVDDEKARFLPHSPESSLFVNCVRKALYLVCESLDSEGLNELLRRIKEDYRCLHGVELETFDPQYMEVNILCWSSRGYISLGDKDGCGVNVHRLKSALKAMGETGLVEKLESAVKATINVSVVYTRVNQPNANISLQSSSDGSLTECRSQHSVASSCDQVEHPIVHHYPVDPNNVGYCVIINQKKFYRDQTLCRKSEVADHELDLRLGTDMDRDRLSETFYSLGFTVWIGQNLTHSDLLKSVQLTLETRVKKEHSCFVLCILSHGERGAVYGSDSIPVCVDGLERLMKDCTKLMGKPKILIIQACQGQSQQDAVSSEDIASDGPVHNRGSSTDFMTFWSTVPGFASFRHEIEGTWFIQAVCQQLLCTSPTDDLYKLFTSVNREVSSKRACVEKSYKTMVPIFYSTFTRFLVLPLHPGAKVKVSQRMFERHTFNALLREYIKDRKQKTEHKRKFR